MKTSHSSGERIAVRIDGRSGILGVSEEAPTGVGGLEGMKKAVTEQAVD